MLLQAQLVPVFQFLPALVLQQLLPAKHYQFAEDTSFDMPEVKAEDAAEVNEDTALEETSLSVQEEMLLQENVYLLHFQALL